MRIVPIALLCWVTTTMAGPLDEGRALMSAGEPARAAELLAGALDDPAIRTEGLILITRAYNELEDYKQAIRYGKQAVEAAPQSSDAHYAYAVGLRNKMQQVSKMSAMFTIGTYKSELRRAIELDPRNVDARLEEIGFLIEAPGIAGGDRKKAREKIAALKPLEWRETMMMQALLNRREDNPQGVIDTYAEMVAKDADDLPARRALAHALQAQGRYREADTHFEYLLGKGADHPRWPLGARYQLARSRVLGEYEQERAVEYLREYIEQITDSVRGLPSKSHAYWRLGLAHGQLGQLDAARRALETAVRLDGGNKDAQKALAALGR